MRTGITWLTNGLGNLHVSAPSMIPVLPLNVYTGWNNALSCGPIVEQATHVLSLSLLFGGAADLSSVYSHTIIHSDPAGRLNGLRFDEEGLIPAEARIPRQTHAIWRYENGALGSLVHALALHGQEFDTSVGSRWLLRAVR